MKKYFGILLLSALTLISYGQKPRYFTGTPLLCPFDYGSLSQQNGLRTTSNNASLQITLNTTRKQLNNIVDAGNNLISNTYTQLNDTSFLITKVAKKNYAFEVIQEIGNYSIVKYWKTKKLDENNADIKTFLSTLSGKAPFSVMTQGVTYKDNNASVNDTKDYYLIKNKDLEKFSKEFEYKKNKWSMGLLVLPVKLRVFADTTGQFEFSDGFSIGTSFSWTFKHKWTNDKTYNWVFYAGISTISVDSIKTRNTTNAAKIPAFSPATGFMIEKGGIQLGIFIGWDFPLGKIHKEWVYRNRPWIGIGLGFSIFKIQGSDNQESGNN